MLAAWPFGSRVTAPTHPLSAAPTAAWFHVPSPGKHCDGRLLPANQGLLGWVGRKPGGQSPAAGLARRGHCCGHQKIAPHCKMPLCTEKPSLPGQAPCPYHQRIYARAGTPVAVQTSWAGSRGISAIPLHTPAHPLFPVFPAACTPRAAQGIPSIRLAPGRLAELGRGCRAQEQTGWKSRKGG